MSTGRYENIFKSHPYILLLDTFVQEELLETKSLSRSMIHFTRGHLPLNKYEAPEAFLVDHVDVGIKGIQELMEGGVHGDHGANATVITMERNQERDSAIILFLTIMVLHAMVRRKISLGQKMVLI